MRRNAIARIIVFSILIFLLLGILLTGLGVGMFMVELGISDSDYTTAQTSTVLFSPEEIRNIQIEWASGNIDIQTGDTDSIVFTESGGQEPMIYKQVGDTVYISFQEPRIQIGFFSVQSKDLTVTVPKNWVCGELTMDVASADVKAEHLTAEQVSIDIASGDCQFLDCAIGKLEIDTASGSVSYEGTLDSLDCDAASGKFVGILQNTPRSIEMDSASGDLDITLPADTGFRATVEALGGKFFSDFPAHYDGDSYTYGDERCKIDFDGASGSIRIRNAE